MAEEEDTKPLAPKGTPAEPNLAERMEGLQGWMAEIERKQNRTIYFGGAAVALALVAAAAALFLAITTPTTASKDDFDDLEAQVQALQDQVSKSAEAENALKSIQATVQSLEQRIAGAEQKATQNAGEIASLKQKQQQLQKQQQAQVAQGATTTTTPQPAAPGDQGK
jgi:septal ring factor EnvC (AmiA/AmiB activator)